MKTLEIFGEPSLLSKGCATKSGGRWLTALPSDAF
jgi:hypothetical protein